MHVWIAWALAGFLTVAAGQPDLLAEELPVKVDNLSKPVRCAEEDNITLTLSAPSVSRFRIVAEHPTYLAALREDNWDADWTACNFGPEHEKTNENAATAATKAAPARPPERVTLYEAHDRWLVGFRLADFWRKATATVKVGDKTSEGIHLLQLWRVRPNGGEEVVVIYPQDGYWRARPRAPKGRDLTAFGSSFLIGPIEQQERPIVRLREVRYDPALEGFTLDFAAGGSAKIKIAEMSEKQLALDVELSGINNKLPFAALRSMYVTAYNNDVEAVAWRKPAANGWSEADIMTFKGGDALELWAGRRAISRHNTSSPDMVFKWFRK